MSHHRRGLRRQAKRAGLPADWIDQILVDWRKAQLSASQAAMLDYVDKLTRAPASMEQADVTKLKQAGLSDRGILDICEVAAYYAYVNRIADGLGVELEEED